MYITIIIFAVNFKIVFYFICSTRKNEAFLIGESWFLMLYV